MSGDEQHVELGWIARAQSALTAKYVDDQRLDDVTDWIETARTRDTSIGKR